MGCNSERDTTAAVQVCLPGARQWQVPTYQEQVGIHGPTCVCVCVCACVRACVRACVCVWLPSMAAVLGTVAVSCYCSRVNATCIPSPLDGNSCDGGTPSSAGPVPGISLCTWAGKSKGKQRFLITVLGNPQKSYDSKYLTQALIETHSMLSFEIEASTYVN